MIKHVIFDVDGVLTTGQFLYDINGKAYKIFGPHDFDGLKMLKKLFVTINFITADKRGFEITKKRIVTDCGFKEDQLTLVTEENRFDWIKSRFDLSAVAFVADGYHDAPILKQVAVGIAPNSARREAKAAAKYVTESDAGNGAVLDACLIIKQELGRTI
jgi:3-deoxy-D-manno-octulosonate 8-phosphate phosphatase (KDO 8-P phosphatase)